MSEAISVLVVEDNDDMRFLLNTVFGLANDVTVVGVAETAEEGFALWREHRPDAVVLDYRLPDAHGLHLAARIRAERPDQYIVLFSAFLDKATIESATDVDDCISKEEARHLPDLLRRSLR